MLTERLPDISHPISIAPALSEWRVREAAKAGWLMVGCIKGKSLLNQSVESTKLLVVAASPQVACVQDKARLINHRKAPPTRHISTAGI